MATTRARPEFASAWWWVALYVLSGYLSYRLGAVDDSIDYIWLPTGVTVGAFMLRPVRDWPLLGGLFLLAQWLLGGFELGRWLDALLYAVDDVGAAALAVWLIQRTGFALEGLYFLRSVIFAGLLAGVVAALGDAAWLSLRGGHATLGAVAIGAASSFVGVLLVTPVLASWSRFRAHRSGDHERFDLWLGIACFVLMVVSATLVFSESAARIDDIGILFSLTYIPLFLTVVVTILLGGRSGSVSMLVLALIAIGLTAQDDGPFAWLDDHHGHSLLEVQFYLAIASLLVLTVSTLKTNRERVHEQAARQQNNVALALAGAGQLAYVLDPQSGQLEWTGELGRVFGAGIAAGQVASLPLLLERLHPDDRAALRESWSAEQAQDTRAPLRLRVIQPDGGTLAIVDHGSALRDASAEVAVFAGVWLLGDRAN
jgi:integral membrane sensor domain MASE1